MALATHGTFLAGSQNAPGKFHGLQVELGLSASIDFVPPIVRSRTERWDWKGTSKRPDTSEHAYKDQGTNVVKRKAVQPIIPTFTCTPPPRHLLAICGLTDEVTRALSNANSTLDDPLKSPDIERSRPTLQAVIQVNDTMSGPRISPVLNQVRLSSKYLGSAFTTPGRPIQISSSDP